MHDITAITWVNTHYYILNQFTPVCLFGSTQRFEYKRINKKKVTLYDFFVTFSKGVGYVPPMSIIMMEKIFSANVFAATFPNPTDVKLEQVK